MTNAKKFKVRQIAKRIMEERGDDYLETQDELDRISEGYVNLEEQASHAAAKMTQFEESQDHGDDFARIDHRRQLRQEVNFCGEQIGTGKSLNPLAD